MDLSRDEDTSGSGGCDCDCDCDFSCDLEGILLIVGIVLIIVAVIDMIVLYTIPAVITKNNKKKYPNATFEKPKTSIVVCHFILHIALIVIGILLILYSNCNIDKWIFTVILAIGLALFISMYITLSWLCYKSRSYLSLMSFTEMGKKLNNTQPIEYFFYTPQVKFAVIKMKK